MEMCGGGSERGGHGKEGRLKTVKRRMCKGWDVGEGGG